MKNIINKRWKKLVLVSLALFICILVYHTNVSLGVDCDRGYLCDCYRPCIVDLGMVVAYSDAGTVRCYPYTHLSQGAGTSCGRYYYFTGIDSHGAPVCDNPGSWSSYTHTTRACDPVFE